MKGVTVNILGTVYDIKYVELKDAEIDGDCDNTGHLIRVRADNTNNVANMEELQKVTLRHELIHAYLFESGLGFSWQHPEQFGHDETTVDWFARMSPKIFKTFQELGLL